MEYKNIAWISSLINRKIFIFHVNGFWASQLLFFFFCYLHVTMFKRLLFISLKFMFYCCTSLPNTIFNVPESNYVVVYIPNYSSYIQCDNLPWKPGLCVKSAMCVCMGNTKKFGLKLSLKRTIFFFYCYENMSQKMNLNAYESEQDSNVYKEYTIWYQ